MLWYICEGVADTVNSTTFTNAAAGADVTAAEVWQCEEEKDYPRGACTFDTKTHFDTKSNLKFCLINIVPLISKQHMVIILHCLSRCIYKHFIKSGFNAHLEFSS